MGMVERIETAQTANARQAFPNRGNVVMEIEVGLKDSVPSESRKRNPSRTVNFYLCGNDR
jgi:hypothetical protein